MAKLNKSKEVENKEIELNNDVNVEAPIDVETNDELDVKTNEGEVETPVVEVDTPVADDVEVDTKAEVNLSNKPNGNAKIRMRVDHKCCIAMERYDLKAGKVYTVPVNVKNILNKAGFLAPL